jgi:hypothetical protein
LPGAGQRDTVSSIESDDGIFFVLSRGKYKEIAIENAPKRADGI